MNESFTSAFPVRQLAEVSRLGPLVDPPTGRDASHTFHVFCDGESLQIPQRIYRPVISYRQFASLNSVEQAIACCWFTRHYDGYVRERFLRALPVYDTPWVIAYIVTLCGEYVVELLQYIWDHRELFETAVLGRWLRDNKDFYSRTRDRIVSYWHCYQRSSCARFDAYVGSALITYFDECSSKTAT